MDPELAGSIDPIFSRVRFILSRFGRLIWIFDIFDPRSDEDVKRAADAESSKLASTEIGPDIVDFMS